ncbi:FIST N-terminal domain-containing protein [Nautilia sp.]
MKFKTFYSTNTSFFYAVTEIKKRIDAEFGEYDFIFFGIHPEYEVEEINFVIGKVFENPEYVGFHAINLFSDTKIIKGVVAGVFKFERKGKVNIYYCKNLSKYNLYKTRDYLNGRRQDTHFIIASLADEYFSFFIETLSSKLDYFPVNNIIGGISSGEKYDGEVRTFQFVDGEIIKNGFIIVSFENVDSRIDMSLGFLPYGITYEITKCDKNKIYTVDYDKNFSDILRRILKGIKNPKEEYLWYLPINIMDDDGYVSTLRTVEKLENEYIKLYGPVKKHQKFKLSFATKYDLIREDERLSKKLAKKLDKIEAAFNFSCVARQYILDDKQRCEPRIYVENFGSHLFGFFTFGEIGPDKKYKKLKLYNETSLVCIMKEK